MKMSGSSQRPPSDNEKYETYDKKSKRDVLGYNIKLEPDKIEGATTNENGDLVFLMSRKGTDQADLVSAEEANRRSPRQVIEFYVERLTFNVPVYVEPLRSHGFQRNLEPEKFSEAINTRRQLMFVMKWRGTDEVGLVAAEEVYERCQLATQLAIKFFEGRLNWNDE